MQEKDSAHNFAGCGVCKCLLANASKAVKCWSMPGLCAVSDEIGYERQSRQHYYA